MSRKKKTIRESSQEKLKIWENIFLFEKFNFKVKDAFILFRLCYYKNDIRKKLNITQLNFFLNHIHMWISFKQEIRDLLQSYDSFCIYLWWKIILSWLFHNVKYNKTIGQHSCQYYAKSRHFFNLKSNKYFH